jgi:hypothetical protein
VMQMPLFLFRTSARLSTNTPIAIFTASSPSH